MAQNETVPYSNSVKREAEQLLEWLKNPNIAVICYNGWHGVGRSRIAEYVKKLANEINLFDIFISVNLRYESSRRVLQLIIAESLGIQSRTMDEDEDEDVDASISVQIYEKLKDKRFLLVWGGLEYSPSSYIDLTGIGVPNLTRRFTSGSKLISKVILVAKYLRSTSNNAKDLVANLSVSNVTELIREEAALAAHSAGTKCYFSPDTIMHFIYYFSLAIRNYYYYSFVEDKEWMIRYWIAEELITETIEKDEEALMERMDALLTELHDRAILEWDGKSVTPISEVRESLMQDETMGKAKFDLISFVSEDGLPEEDDESFGWEVYQRMSAIITTEKINVNIPPSPKCPNLSTLILRFYPGRPDHYKFLNTFPDRHDRFGFPITFFAHMKNLRVLDLCEAPIESLPSSLSSLCNLKLLSLQRCEKLVSLPTSLRDLIRLEFLNLSECFNLKVIPEECFELMDRLRVLDLSHTQIDSLPSSVFKLYDLQQLLLTYCRALKSLPSSLSNLVNLEKLNLSHCDSLITGVSPQSLQNLTSLKELDLSCCGKLEDIRDASFHDTLPKLQRLNISDSSTPHRLSFRGCESLETLDLSYLSHLEVLHILYGTKFNTLRLGGTCSYLRHLDILPTRYSYIQFEVLNWRDDDVGARIWVEDPKSKLKISTDVFQAPCFSRFYIRISPFEEEGCIPMTIDKFQNIHLKRKPVVYKSIHHSHTKTFLFSHFASRSAFDRTLEICRSNSSLHPMLLARTESITFLCNTSDRGTLSPASWLSDLKEYRIGGCPKIPSLFPSHFAEIPSTFYSAGGDLDILRFREIPSISDSARRDLDILPLLEVIWVSDLPQLTAICEVVYGKNSFALLKHIYIEHCPKLEALFTSGMYFQSLETLEIKFCCRLQKLFETEAVAAEVSLQNLHSLRLLHVPKLKSVCNGFLPRLEKVQVQRCPMLRKLPIQVCLIDGDINGSGYAASSSLPVVEIRGETKWWKNLQWDNKDDRNKRPARFRPWRRTPSTLLSHGIEW